MIILLIYILLIYNTYYNNGIIFVIKMHVYIQRITHKDLTLRNIGEFQTSELMEVQQPITFLKTPIRCQSISVQSIEKFPKPTASMEMKQKSQEV